MRRGRTWMVACRTKLLFLMIERSRKAGSDAVNQSGVAALAAMLADMLAQRAESPFLLSDQPLQLLIESHQLPVIAFVERLELLLIDGDDLAKFLFR